MKVTFTCEKCGVVLASGSTISERLPDIEMDAARSACRCSELTYGPLTVKMLAEALIANADEWGAGTDYDNLAWWEFDSRQKELSEHTARFVLRLLGECVESNRDGTVIGPDVRAWLLDLARKP